MQQTILIIEDDADIAESLEYNFKREGFRTVIAESGEKGLLLAIDEKRPPALIVLDLMLPRLDGISVLKTLRAAKSPSHVLVLTARDTTEDRVKGLDSGADDYLVKPFQFAELLARVRALVRRRYETKSSTVRIGELELDTASRQVKRPYRHT